MVPEVFFLSPLGALSSAASTVIVVVAVAVAPWSSVTVSVTVLAPVVLYVRAGGSATVDVPPSPKFQA